MLLTVLSGESGSLFTESFELMPELSAEMGVAAQIGVIVHPVAVVPVTAVLPDAVLCCEEQVSDTISRVSGNEISPYTG